MPVSILSVSYDYAPLMTRQLMLEARGYRKELLDGADYQVWPDDPHALIQEIAAISPPLREHNAIA